MSKENDDPITEIRTDIQWIKASLTDIKAKIDELAGNQRRVVSDLAAVKQKVKFHDQLIAAMIGAGITALLWILSHLI